MKGNWGLVALHRYLKFDVRENNQRYFNKNAKSFSSFPIKCLSFSTGKTQNKISYFSSHLLGSVIDQLFLKTFSQPLDLAVSSPDYVEGSCASVALRVLETWTKMKPPTFPKLVIFVGRKILTQNAKMGSSCLPPYQPRALWERAALFFFKNQDFSAPFRLKRTTSVAQLKRTARWNRSGLGNKTAERQTRPPRPIPPLRLTRRDFDSLAVCAVRRREGRGPREDTGRARAPHATQADAHSSHTARARRHTRVARWGSDHPITFSSCTWAHASAAL